MNPRGSGSRRKWIPEEVDPGGSGSRRKWFSEEVHPEEVGPGGSGSQGAPSDLDVLRRLHGCPPAAAAAVALHVHLGDVEQGFEGAAHVHEGEDAGGHLAAELREGEIGYEGQQGHGRQVVEHDDAQDDQHHLEGFLLHGVHLLLACHRAPQCPDDGDVAEQHDDERGEDEATENLDGAHHVHHALGDAVAQNQAPARQGNAHPESCCPGYG